MVKRVYLCGLLKEIFGCMSGKAVTKYVYTCTWLLECGRTLQNPRVLYFPLLSHMLLTLILEIAFNGFF